jgi:transposase
MRTSKNRARYDRSKLLYPSDLTDDEWRLIEPLIPPGKTDGGKRTVIMRENSNFVGSWTGRSPGFSPLRTRPT